MNFVVLIFFCLLLQVPDAAARAAILALHARRLPLSSDVDLTAIADGCFGYSGADLASLCREVAMVAISEAAAATFSAAAAAASAPVTTVASGGGLLGTVTSAHFEAAKARVGPSIVRGLSKELPRVLWSDLGGLDGVKAELERAVEWPLRHRDAFERLGLPPPGGVLL